ncbi:MlaD family protein [Thalassotalea ponticola]|uniref:PqiB family protein n=1 Tax=Thalassotalea ponticola TaxID=1523392 RepID=UPI0025B2D159|nr:MlaD family protein [Thalassotalea ponticola]MDN3651510.1 MlaD family protein [Thalassotalea ponticola]
MTETSAIISNKRHISWVWALPVLAALIGLWLLYRSVVEAGIDITIKVDSAEGIVVNKTEVRYKGFVVGLVTDLDLQNLTTVLVTVRMDKSIRSYLTQGSGFWLVKPDISLSGVSGIDTVFTGNYFEFLPGEGERGTRQYVALSEPPPKSDDEPGLHIVLRAKELGSIRHGSGVFYKQIRVGEVYGYQLLESAEYLAINVLIEPEYEHLVKLNSRFWNASGIDMSGDLSGFKIRTQSIGAIVNGGIAFYTPDINTTSTVVNDFTEYALYQDFDQARSGIKVTMHFPKQSGIKAGITKVMFEGIEVGLVKEFIRNSEQGGVSASVLMDPRLEPYLLSNMQFWMVKPRISLTGVNNIERLLSGAYVAFRLGDGQPAREFNVLASEPPLPLTEQGLHLYVTTDSVESVPFGAPVFYRYMQVGTVQGYQLDSTNSQFNVHVFIKPEYEHLVNSSSVFFELGGVDINASLRAINIDVGPMQTILAGGIAFETLDFNGANSVNDGERFSLARSFAEATYDKEITLIAPNTYPMLAGTTALKFQDDTIGMVKRVVPANDNYSNIVTIAYASKYQHLFREDSRIWVVKPSLSLSDPSALSAFVDGMFLQIQAGQGTASDRFVLLSNAPQKSPTEPGLQIHLYADKSFGLSRGTPVLYKSMTIGQVDTVQVSSLKDSVLIALTIDQSHAHLVKQSSLFYTAGGVSATAGLNGIELNAGNLQSILQGAIEMNNDRALGADKANELHQFRLYESKTMALISGTEITIAFDQVIDIQHGAQIRFNGHVVGRVNEVLLDSQLSQTTLRATITNQYPRLQQHGAKYWHVEPRINVANVKDPVAYLTGNFLRVLPGNGKPVTVFSGLTYEPAVTSLSSGLNLILRSDKRGSLDIGDPIYYKQIQVGEVLGVALNAVATGVDVYANIYHDYAHLVRQGSKFYHNSGVSINASFISGVQINTESIDAVLSGGISFSTPEPNPQRDETFSRVSSGARFKLHAEVDPEWLTWRAKLSK